MPWEGSLAGVGAAAREPQQHTREDGLVGCVLQTRPVACMMEVGSSSGGQEGAVTCW